MAKKTYLKGEIDSPSGHAPKAAWQAVEEQVRRPEDLWVSGDPRSLIDQGHEGDQAWEARISERIHLPSGPVGLRLRFVFPHRPTDELDLIGMAGAVLYGLPEANDGLFLHAEIMTGPEAGLYIAFENRPPALLTQVHFADDQAPSGAFVPVTGPLHINLLLHNPSAGFNEVWQNGTLDSMLERVSTMVQPAFAKGQIHELTIARSDAHPSGISVGLEQVWEEQGSRGGFSAAEEGSRSRVTAEDLKSLGDGAHEEV